MTLIGIGRETEGAGCHAVADQVLHCGYFTVVSFALDAGFAHRKLAHGAMTDEGRDVQTERLSLQRVEIFAVSGPVPRNAGLQGLAWHVLDPYEGADQRIAALRLARRQREAAIAHHDGGDAVVGGR